MGGLANHFCAGEWLNTNTLLGHSAWYRNLSAVTGACLMISRKVFDAVEGFDEGYLLNYSDVDLCLKVVKNGWRIVYTPRVRLLHHESKTHLRNIPRKDFVRASQRWQTWGYLQSDPYFSPNLSYAQASPHFGYGPAYQPYNPTVI
jgi:O-antigen biosynthesis protein